MILNICKKWLKEAIISTPIEKKAAAPVTVLVALPRNMPQERMAAFCTSVANHLRAGQARGEAEATVIRQIANEQQAIGQAIAGEAFVVAMTHAYVQELMRLQTPVAEAEARREVQSIIANRVEDCKNFVALLDQADFMATVRAEATQPAPPAKAYRLSQRKTEEEIANLLTKADGSSQPAVHVAMTARGHQVGHQALANLFRPSGALRAPLVHALAQAWPEATAAQIEHMAEGWLKARHDPAHAIADGLKVGGTLYEEAMRRATLLQEKKIAAAISEPTTATAALRVHQGRVAAPQLMMDAV